MSIRITGIFILFLTYTSSWAADFCSIIEQLKVSGKEPLVIIQTIKSHLDDESFCSDDDRCIGKGLQVIANYYFDLEKYEESLYWTKMAISFRKHISDTLGLIRSWTKMADYYQYFNDFEQYTRVHNFLVNSFPQKKDAQISNIVLGDHFFNIQGDYPLAEKYYRKFYNFCVEIQDSIYMQYSKLLLLRTDRELLKGEPADKLEFLEKYILYFEKQDQISPDFEARFWQADHKNICISEAYKNLFHYYKLVGKEELLLKRIPQAINNYSSILTPDDARIFAFNLADAQFKLRQYEENFKTLMHIDHSIEKNTTTNEITDKSRCYEKLFKVCMVLGKYPEAKNYLRQNQNLLLKLDDNNPLYEMANYDTLKNNHLIFQIINHLANQAFYYNKKYEETCDARPMSLSKKFYQTCDSLIEYEKNYQVLQESKVNKREIYFEIYTRAFTSFLAYEDYALAFYYAEKAKAQLLVNELEESRWISQLPKTVQDSLSHLSRSIKQIDSELSEGNLSGTRSTKQLQVIKTYIDYKNYLTKKYPSKSDRGQVITLSEFQKQLGNNTCALSYLVLDTTLYCFEIYRHNFQVKAGPWTKSTEYLIENILTYLPRKTTEKLDSLPAWLDMAGSIMIPSLPKQIDKLVIMPCREISQLPFACLKDSKNNYLVQSHEIEYQWSASLAYFLSRQNYIRGKVVGFAPGFLQSGERTVSSLTERSRRNGETIFSSLYYSLEELDEVKDAWGGKFFKNFSASSDHFYQNFEGNNSIIHLATHAVAHAYNIDSSFFVMYSNKSDSLSYVRVPDLSLMQSKAQMIVLSGCETGLGKKTFSEGNISLARAFTSCGVGSVVSSLWKVNDASTSYLMKYFYNNLKKGMGKPCALKKAQLDFIENHPEFSHPFYWATFTFYGDPRPINKSFFQNWLPAFLN